MFKKTLLALAAVMGWKFVSNIGFGKAADTIGDAHAEVAWTAMGISKDWIDRVKAE